MLTSSDNDVKLREYFSYLSKYLNVNYELSQIDVRRFIPICATSFTSPFADGSISDKLGNNARNIELSYRDHILTRVRRAIRAHHREKYIRIKVRTREYGRGELFQVLSNLKRRIISRSRRSVERVQMRLVIHSSDVIAGKSYGSDVTSRRSVRYMASERAEDNWIALDESFVQQWDSSETNRA